MSDSGPTRDIPRLPELVAPVGSPEHLPAAVAGGADAVYLGVGEHNARARAANFGLDDLPRTVAWLHHHGRRCFLALNTLVFDDELENALAIAAMAQTAGVDAVILQDLGLWRLIGEQLPDLPRHASTQMSVHSPEQVRLLAGLGARRIVLARECPPAEVAGAVAAGRETGCGIEVFVHGARCWSMSGQCLISAHARDRSANRGRCEQLCRHRFCGADGGTDRFLDLPDLCLLPVLDRVVASGVAALKIEGRLRSPAYVYAACRTYRAALDAIAAGGDLPGEELLRNLRGVFSRGQSLGAWAAGPEGEPEPDAILQKLDRDRGRAVIVAPRPVFAGQGFRFAEEGLLVIGVDRIEGDRHTCRVRVESAGPLPILPADLILNTDQRWQAELAMAVRTVPFDAESRARPVIAVCRLQCGAPVRLELTCGTTTVAVDGDPVTLARSRPLDRVALDGSLLALGGSGYRLAEAVIDFDDHVFVPLASLKALRRRALAALDGAVARAVPVATVPPGDGPRRRPTALWVRSDDPDQVAPLLGAGADRVLFHGDDLTALPVVPADRLWWTRDADQPVAAIPSSLPLLAGHLGWVEMALREHRPIILDATVNLQNRTAVAAALALPVDGVILGRELTAQGIDALLATTGNLPGTIAVIVQDRPPLMRAWWPFHLAPSTGLLRAEEGARQDYLVENVADGRVLIEPMEPVFDEAAAAASRGRADAWVIDCRRQDAVTSLAQVVAWRRQLQEGCASRPS